MLSEPYVTCFSVISCPWDMQSTLLYSLSQLGIGTDRFLSADSGSYAQFGLWEWKDYRRNNAAVLYYNNKLLRKHCFFVNLVWLKKRQDSERTWRSWMSRFKTISQVSLYYIWQKKKYGRKYWNLRAFPHWMLSTESCLFNRCVAKLRRFIVVVFNFDFNTFM